MDGPVLIPAARVLAPLQQGSSNLCSLYSIINALRLATYPQLLHEDEISGLMRAGLTQLSKRSNLSEIAEQGVLEGQWVKLTKAIVATFNELTSSRSSLEYPLLHQTRRDRAGAFDTLRTSIDAGTGVLVALWGRYDHYTVICGYSPSRFYLFDSYGFRWIHVDKLCLLHGRARRRHKLSTRSAAVIAKRK